MKPSRDYSKYLDPLGSYLNDLEDSVTILSNIHIKREAIDDENKEEGSSSAVKKHRTSIVTPITQAPNLSIEDIERHTLRDDRKAIYALNLGKSGGLINRPPQIDVLAYCNRYKDALPWYLSTQAFIASAAEHFDYPDVPVLSRSAIEEFLRAPNTSQGERPCINLDCEPHKDDPRIQCVAHRISSKPKNGGKGFRLRELLLNSTALLDPVPDMCYLCHLWLALRNSTYQRDKKVDKEKVVIINRFMVIIDQPGEYDRTKMLVSEKVNTGLWGPIPLFNEENYIVLSREQRIEESANLLFRLTRVSLPPIDAIPQKASTQYNRTNVTPSAGFHAQ